MIDRATADSWLQELKGAWEGKDVERALALFSHTREYYERPFRAGTTMADYRGYWQDIVGLEDIRFDYDLVAVEGNIACVHWQNEFTVPGSGTDLLDGAFVIEFDDDGRCVVFRQWWFARP